MTLRELRQGLLALGADDLYVSPAGRLVVDVSLGERHQKVRIHSDAEGRWFYVTSRICGVGELGVRVSELAAEILRQNRHQEFLAYGREGDDLIGYLELPSDVAVEEFAGLVRRLAAECDRWEDRLTGDDR